MPEDVNWVSNVDISRWETKEVVVYFCDGKHCSFRRFKTATVAEYYASTDTRKNSDRGPKVHLKPKKRAKKSLRKMGDKKRARSGGEGEQ